MNAPSKPHLFGMVVGLFLAAERSIARLHTADMGVIQIAPIYSGQTSWEGMNDTSSLDKTITAVVTATFALK